MPALKGLRSALAFTIPVAILLGVVRHPLYAGNLLFFAGSALWLGSTAACVATMVQLMATLARIRIE